MRIVYVTANLPHGTDEAFLIPEITALTKLGHEVLIVPRSPEGDVVHGAALLSHSEREDLYSRTVLRTAAAALWERFGVWKETAKDLQASRTTEVAIKNLSVAPKAAWLGNVAAQWGAGHIHCHWAGTTATMAMIASRLSGIPWSLTLHRWDIVENNLLAVKARSATLVRFISEDGMRMGLERGVPAAPHVRVIHMGVDMPPLRQHTSAAANIILCPARLVKVKGHRFLLDAWRMIRSQGIEAELWLAGGGPLREQLETQAGRLGIRNSVRFLGTIPHNRLLEMYEKFGIAAAVLPSVDLGNGNHEGIPVALIEAMSYGVPVIATRTGGTGELIPGGTGLLVRPEHSGELAAAMRSVLCDPPGARRLGDFGRRHVEREYDIRTIAAELAAHFETAGERAAEHELSAAAS